MGGINPHMYCLPILKTEALSLSLYIVRVRTYVRTYIHKCCIMLYVKCTYRIHLPKGTYTDLYGAVRTRTDVYVPVDTYTYLYVPMRTCTYLYVPSYTDLCIPIRTYIPTYRRILRRYAYVQVNLEQPNLISTYSNRLVRYVTDRSFQQSTHTS